MLRDHVPDNDPLNQSTSDRLFINWSTTRWSLHEECLATRLRSPTPTRHRFWRLSSERTDHWHISSEAWTDVLYLLLDNVRTQRFKIRLVIPLFDWFGAYSIRQSEECLV